MDEQTAAVEVPQTTETTTEQAPESTPEQVSTPESTTPGWYAELDKAEPDAIIKHNRVAGIIGDKVQKALAAERQRLSEETATKERERLQASLREKAQNDPAGFAQEWLDKETQSDRISELNKLEANVRNELGKSIGRRLKDEAAWQELSDQSKREFLEKLNGLPENDVIPVFNDMVSDLRAEHRSNKRLSEWKAKELAKEREAIRQEEAARLLKSSDAPDTTGPKGQAKSDVKAMSDEDFDKYWSSLKGI